MSACRRLPYRLCRHWQRRWPSAAGELGDLAQRIPQRGSSHAVQRQSYVSHGTARDHRPILVKGSFAVGESGCKNVGEQLAFGAQPDTVKPENAKSVSTNLASLPFYGCVFSES